MINSIFPGKRAMLLFIMYGIQTAVAQPFLQYDPKTRLTGVWDAADYRPILPCAFDEVTILNGQDLLFIAMKDRKKALYDGKGKQLVPFFDQLYGATEPKIPDWKVWVVVASELPEGMRYGIYRPGKGLVLPVKYKEVYALYPDLIAGRVENPPQEIHFFDEKGTFLYAKEGNSAGRGYDDQTIILRRPGKDWLYYDKKGNDPFPPGFTKPVWMKDSLIIAGARGAVGLFRINGDTVLSPIYTSIRYEENNRFIVQNQQGYWGLSDDRSRFLIPMQPMRMLSRDHRETEEVYIGQSTDMGISSVYNRYGTLLAEDILISFPDMEPAFINRLPRQEPWRYMTMQKSVGGKQGLFCKDGRKILPMEFVSIMYYSEKYPFLASRKDSLLSGINPWQAYNNQGEALLDREFLELKGTASPECFIGLPLDKGAKWGFVPLKKPAEAQYIYDKIIPVLHGCYAGQLGDHWYLLNAEGKKIHAKGFDYITEPIKLQINQFFVEKHRGPLVAVAMGKDIPSGHWIALTLRGQAIPMNPPPYYDEITEHRAEAPPMIEEVMAVEAPPPPPPTREKSPSFPGGETALISYLKEQVRYPGEARSNGIQGRVVLSFWVETDGSLSDIRVIKDIGGGCAEEAIRVVKGMPDWVPGSTNEVPARKLFTLPFVFKTP
jgi:TonB family protein